MLATVGDATTARLLLFKIIPDVSVVDGKERRIKSSKSKIVLGGDKDSKNLSFVRCSNKPGSVSRRAIETIRDALKMPFPVRIVVSGEEDLLALPLFVMVPNGSVVLYGQPLEGMVIVRIDEKIRWKARDLLYRIGAPIC
ncbi:MAG TPA: GTP-dependent dephospho-CoA kinase family protein [Nitrososphaeraceae archaeon]|nr:GTP-dependent dephospho-CoA kinase family protein [Nitrososphaeraceae archaeon]